MKCDSIFQFRKKNIVSVVLWRYFNVINMEWNSVLFLNFENTILFLNIEINVAYVGISTFFLTILKILPYMYSIIKINNFNVTIKYWIRKSSKLRLKPQKIINANKLEICRKLKSSEKIKIHIQLIPYQLTGYLHEMKKCRYSVRGKNGYWNSLKR